MFDIEEVKYSQGTAEESFMDAISPTIAVEGRIRLFIFVQQQKQIHPKESYGWRYNS